jgi:RNA-binding protein
MELKVEKKSGRKKAPELAGYKNRFLRGLAHGSDPVVTIGQKGASPTVIRAVTEALNRHELIKVKFNEHKEKRQKLALIDHIARQTGSAVAGMIGHTALFYRAQKDPKKRNITLPRH